MESLLKTKGYIIKWTIILDLLLMIVILFLFDLKSMFGIFVGGLMSILNFHLLSLSLKKAVNFEPVKAGIYVFIQYILRYTLWFAVFYIALKRSDVNLLTTVIGMFTVKIVILVSNLFNCLPKEQDVNLERKEGD